MPVRILAIFMFFVKDDATFTAIDDSSTNKRLSTFHRVSTRSLKTDVTTYTISQHMTSSVSACSTQCQRESRSHFIYTHDQGQGLCECYQEFPFEDDDLAYNNTTSFFSRCLVDQGFMGNIVQDACAKVMNLDTYTVGQEEAQANCERLVEGGQAQIKYISGGFAFICIQPNST